VQEIEDETCSALSLLQWDDWKELSRARIEPVVSGFSGATIFRAGEDGRPLRYLKIARDDAAVALREEIMRTGWLAERGLRVPAILRYSDLAHQIGMLTEAVPGFPADASPLSTSHPIDALARGLAALH
jgi:aminoglycoside phosphotransferase